MTTAPVEPSSNDFLRSSLRWLAIVCIAYAGVSLIKELVALTVQGWPRYSIGFRASGWQRFDLFNVACSTASLITLLVGGYGMLKWRRWSRLTLLSGGIALIVFHFISTVTWLFFYANQIAAARAATRAAVNYPSIWFYAWTSLCGWLTSSAFPAIIIWATVQRDVVSLWARGAFGGFEVVPMAKAIEGSAP